MHAGLSSSGPKRFLEPYGLGATQIDELQASLVKSTAADDPVTAADLAAVVDAGRTWRVLIANVVDLRRSQGRAAAEAVIEGQGPKRRFDTFRFLSARLSTRLLDQRREARAESERTAGRMTWLLFVLPAILVAFTLASGWRMARWIVRPLRRLLLAVRSITSGDLSTNVSVGGAADVADCYDVTLVGWTAAADLLPADDGFAGSRHLRSRGCAIDHGVALQGDPARRASGSNGTW